MSAKAAKEAKVIVALQKALRANAAVIRQSEQKAQSDRFARIAAGKPVAYSLNQRYV